MDRTGTEVVDVHGHVVMVMFSQAVTVRVAV